MRHARAFTLVELIIVLLIMAAFAGMVMPAMTRALRGARAETTGNNLREMLDFAHTSAVSQRRSVVVNIAPARRKCWITLRRASLPWLPESEADETRTLAAMALPEGTRITLSRGEQADVRRVTQAAWETVTFHSDGRTEDVVIELDDASGRRVEIEIVGATGRASVRRDLEG